MRHAGGGSQVRATRIEHTFGADAAPCHLLAARRRTRRQRRRRRRPRHRSCRRRRPHRRDTRRIDRRPLPQRRAGRSSSCSRPAPTVSTGSAPTTLQRPEQFYCDMTTDGGGWVLIGRGREGWTFRDYGQQTPDAVRSTINGPAAFEPAALSTDLINGLLDGGAGQGPRRRRPSRACPQCHRNPVAGRPLAIRRSRHLVVGHRRRSSVELVLDRRCRWHRIEHQGLACHHVERGRRRQPGRQERIRLVHLSVEWPRQERRLLLWRRHQRVERLLDVSLRVRLGEPGDPVHADVHPTTDHDSGAGADRRHRHRRGGDPSPARRSPGGARRRCVGRLEDRRLRAATRRPGARHHDDRRPRLHRRQVLPGARHRDGPTRQPSVSRGVRSSHGCMDPVVRSEARRNGVGSRVGRRSPDRRRSVHQRRRRRPHVGTRRARPDHRRRRSRPGGRR